MAFAMPWSSGSKSTSSGTNDNKTNVSLDDILPTTVLRVELILLVVLCSDAMRNTMDAAFEMQDTQAVSPPRPPLSPKPSDDLIQLAEEGDNSNSKSSGASESQRRDMSYVRNLDLGSAGLQSLKSASTTHFNAWRTSVLRRLGEKLKVQPDAVKRAKANYNTSREAETKARKHLEDFDFTDKDDPKRPRAVSPSMADGTPLIPTLSNPDPTPTASSSTAQPTDFRTKLNDLPAQTRALILNATLFILLSLEHYPAQSRVLLARVSSSLDLPVDVLASAEANLAITLRQSTSPAKSASASGRPPLKSSGSDNASRGWKIGLATVAGAALVGVTGGLAAPFLLGAAGAIMGGVGLGGLASLLGATVANPVTVAALFGVLGGRVGKNAMEELTREVENFEVVPVLPLTDAEKKRLAEEEQQQEKTGKTDKQNDREDRILWDMDQEERRQAPVPEPSTLTATSASKSRSTQDSPSTDPMQLLPPHLRTTLCISAPLYHSVTESTTPWLCLSAQHSTPLALRYEPAALLRLGESLSTVLRNSAYSLAQAGALQLALPALSAALLPVSLLSLGSWLDSPFSVAMDRSDKAGKVLAQALRDTDGGGAGLLGRRPVTLIGYGLGARVVYSCLMELARADGQDASKHEDNQQQRAARPRQREDPGRSGLGIVENVVMMGAPVPSDASVWRRIRAVVAGRVVNVHTTSDLLLGYMYRVRYAQLGVAGLEPVREVRGVESYDVTGTVRGQSQYRLAVGRVLREIGWEGLDETQLEEQAWRLAREDEQQKEIHDAAWRSGELDGQEDGRGRIVMVDSTAAVDHRATERGNGVRAEKDGGGNGKKRGRGVVSSDDDDGHVVGKISQAADVGQSRDPAGGDGDVGDPEKEQQQQQQQQHPTRQLQSGREHEREHDDMSTTDSGDEASSLRGIEMISLEPEPEP